MRVPKQYLGAFIAGHRQNARHFIDEALSWNLLKKIQESNYTDQKSMDALAYITRFNDEFHKNVIKKDDPNSLHCTAELRKSLYSRENSKNRDIMSRENKFLESLAEPQHNLIQRNGSHTIEDTLIDLIEATTPKV